MGCSPCANRVFVPCLCTVSLYCVFVLCACACCAGAPPVRRRGRDVSLARPQPPREIPSAPAHRKTERPLPRGLPGERRPRCTQKSVVGGEPAPCLLQLYSAVPTVSCLFPRSTPLTVIASPNRDVPLLRQGVYHEKVVPVVCGLVSDAAQPVRVRGHAAAAIVNFSDTEDVPEEAVTPHLDALLSALCSCLNGGVPQSVQVCCPREHQLARSRFSRCSVQPKYLALLLG